MGDFYLGAAVSEIKPQGHPAAFSYAYDCYWFICKVTLEALGVKPQAIPAPKLSPRLCQEPICLPSPPTVFSARTGALFLPPWLL